MPDPLELELRSLQLEWPETPDLGDVVLARLSDAPGDARAGRGPLPRVGPAGRRPPRAGAGARVGRRPRWRAGLAYGAAVLVAALAITMAVSPSARSAILELLGLRGARIERREPDAPRRPARAPLGADLGLGERRSLAQARREAGFRLAVPTAERLGAPDAVYLDRFPPAGVRVSLVYGERRGIPRSRQTGAALLVMQFRAGVDQRVISKATGGGARVEPVRVDGERGYFISGRPHGFAFIGESGEAGFEDQRLAGSTLLLERGDTLLRIEGEVSREEAIAIARSAR